nr:hypothetical protein [Mycobacterium lepromatosis]
MERSGRFFTLGEFSVDLRIVTRRGGREGDALHRDRWRRYKVVPVHLRGQPHWIARVWKIYVKDGIITGKPSRPTIRL